MRTIKNWWMIGCALCVSTLGTAQYINEFHYNNVGSDVDEFVEVVIINPQPEDLENYRLYTYNGSDSMIILQRSLNGLTPGCTGDTCYYVWTRQDLLQNGPDGIAFAYINGTDTVLFDFISYGGTIEALDGPARGQTSMDVGITEPDSTPVGWSLQLDTNGLWVAGPATPGIVNPVELLSFTGEYMDEDQGVLLEWTTATEVNNSHFEIEVSRDQHTYRAIATIPGAGNSHEVHYYSYFDTEPIANTIFYRLKQVDFDGNYQYSPVIEVQISNLNSISDLVPVYHNHELYLKNTDFKGVIHISLYDTLGRRFLQRKGMAPGDIIRIHSIETGIFFFRIRSGNQSHSGTIAVASSP